MKRYVPGIDAVNAPRCTPRVSSATPPNWCRFRLDPKLIRVRHRRDGSRWECRIQHLRTLESCFAYGRTTYEATAVALKAAKRFLGDGINIQLLELFPHPWGLAGVTNRPGVDALERERL